MEKLLFIYLLSIASVFAATKHDYHLPINHCYHWINEKSNNYLSFKYDFASKNSNELTFFTTPGSSNGAVAGAGLYCAKSPSGSYNYGDRLIRVELVDDIVLYDDNTGIKHCGTDGTNSNNSPSCASKSWDIKFYSGGGAGNSAWYVIQNPESIKSWSANSDQLINDLKESIKLNDSSFQAHANNAIQYMEYERDQLGEKILHTQTTRSSIVEIIVNNPEKLNSFPALSIISRLAVDKNKALSDIERIEIYKRYIGIALKSKIITYKNIKNAMKNDLLLKNEVSEFLSHSLKSKKDINPYFLLEAMLDTDQTFNVDVSKYYDFVLSKIFLGGSSLSKFSISNHLINPKIKNLVKRKLSKLINSDDLLNHISPISNMIKTVYSTKEIKKIQKKILNSLNNSSSAEVSITLGSAKLPLGSIQSNVIETCKIMLSVLDSEGDLELNYYKSNISIGQVKKGKSYDLICASLDSIYKNVSNLKNSKQIKIKYVLKGNISNNPYVFVGENRDQLISQCNQFMASKSIVKTDSIYWSLNGSSVLRAYNSDSYWNVSAACLRLNTVLSPISYSKSEFEIEKRMLDFLEAEDNEGKKYKVVGRFESQRYFLFGYNRDEIINQCNQYSKYLPRKFSVDDIYWSVDDSSEQKIYNSEGYWKNIKTICEQLDNALALKIPSKAEIEAEQKLNEMMAEWSKKGNKINNNYVVTGRIEKTKIFFFGINSNEIIQQCKAYYKYIPNKSKVDEIFWSVNRSTESKLYNSDGYWKTENSVCNSLGGAINSIVPTKRMLELQAISSDMKKKQKNSSAKYKLSARIELQEFYYYGDSRDAIIAQCENSYRHVENKSAVDEVYWSVNNSSETKLYNSKTYWKTKNSLCNAISGAISTLIPSINEQNYLRLLSENKEEFILSNAVYKLELKLQEAKMYLFGNNISEISTQCGTAYEDLVLNKKIDDIYISINGATPVRKYNSSSYWETKRATCAVITSHLNTLRDLEEERQRQKELREEFIVTQKAGEEEFNQSTSSYMLSGFAEDIPFYFVGENQEEILQQCRDLVLLSPSKKINGLVSLDINGESVTLRNTSTTRSFCIDLQRNIAQKVLTKREVDIKEFVEERKAQFDTSSAKYKGFLKLNNNLVYLNVDSSDEVYNQCIDSANYFNRIDEDITMEFINSETSDVEISTEIQLERNTSDELCLQVQKELLSVVLAPEVEIMKEEQASSGAKYFISGMFGLTPYYFYGDSASDFKNQCNDHYSTLKMINDGNKLSSFTWKIEGSSKSYYVKKSKTLKSRRSLCMIFGKNLKKQLK